MVYLQEISGRIHKLVGLQNPAGGPGGGRNLSGVHLRQGRHSGKVAVPGGGGLPPGCSRRAPRRLPRPVSGGRQGGGPTGPRPGRGVGGCLQQDQLWETAAVFPGQSVGQRDELSL